MADQIKIEILEDGTLSIETEGISGKNHMSADEFITAIEKTAGGKRQTKQKTKLVSESTKTTTHTH